MNIMTEQMDQAILGNKYEVAKRLLENGEDPNSQTESGNPALYCAVAYGSSSLISLLIEHGADVNAINKEGETPFFVAANQHEILPLVEAGANIHARNESGETALHFAARAGWTEAVALHLYLGLDMYEKSESDLTAPYYAFEADSPYGVLAIFKIAGYNFAGENGTDTPLHRIIHRCKAHFIPWLLKNGANISFVDGEGRTAREFLDFLYAQSPAAKVVWGWSQNGLDAVKAALDAHAKYR